MQNRNSGRANLLGRIFLAGVTTLFTATAATAIPVPSSPDREQATSAEPSDDAGFAAARGLLQQGKYDEALAALHDLEAKHPTNPHLAHELGTANYKKGDY